MTRVGRVRYITGSHVLGNAAITDAEQEVNGVSDASRSYHRGSEADAESVGRVRVMSCMCGWMKVGRDRNMSCSHKLGNETSAVAQERREESGTCHII